MHKLLKMQLRQNINPRTYLGLSTDKERLDFLALLASLAPSSHNMQPWFFRFSEKGITLLPNEKRRLKVADPLGREFYITLGTVIGNFQLAASSFGLKYEESYSADLTREIYSIRFADLTPAAVPDYQTLDALASRHNSRLLFNSKRISESDLNELKAFTTDGVTVEFITDAEKQEKIKRITLESVRRAFKDPGFRQELAPWLKPSIGKHEDGLVGKNLGMPFLISLIFPTLTKYTDTSEKQVQIFDRMFKNVPVYGIISASAENPVSWLKVGQVFESIAVSAERKGISLGVMQAAVEDDKYNPELAAILGVGKPQMFFRLGYSDLIHVHSPRIPISKLTK